MQTAEKIQAANLAAIKERASNPQSNIKQVAQKRKSHPYRGFVTCEVDGCEPFALFCNNDLLPALHMFWIPNYRFEPGSLAIWSSLCRQSKCIYDIGAHVGIFSLAAYSANPRADIVAFEPVDFIFARLLVNLFANGANRVDARQLALSNANQWAEINLRLGPQILSTGSSIEDHENIPEGATKRWIQTVDLETAADGKDIDLMKIDVEGHEMAVLAGGRSTFERCKPLVLCEVLPREFRSEKHGSEVMEYFAELGYDSYAISEKTKKLTPFMRGDAPTAGVKNYLLVHRERSDMIEPYKA